MDILRKGHHPIAPFIAADTLAQAGITCAPCLRSPKLEEVRYTASCQEAISEALACLLAAPKLAVLGLTPRNVMLLPGQLHTLGLLPLTELRLNSYVSHIPPAPLPLAPGCVTPPGTSHACMHPVPVFCT